MILSNEEIKNGNWSCRYDDRLENSHLEANARIRELEMQLENCRLDVEGFGVALQEKQSAEAQLLEAGTLSIQALKRFQEMTSRAASAEAKLWELVEAAEWRDECQLEYKFWVPSPVVTYADDEFGKTVKAAEAAYKAALAAAKEE